MDRDPDSLAAEHEALKAALAEAQAQVSADKAMIAHLQLTIEKLKRDKFRPALRAHGVSARSDGIAA